jgi:predicted dehydrogenase
MKKRGVGILGYGWVAGAHLKAFVDLPSFEPVAILSRRKLDREQIKQSHNADVKIYDNYDTFLADKDIEIVDICTEHPLHSQQAIRAAEAGKDLIIEKPAALNFEDAVKMRKAIAKNKVHASVCFEARFISVAKAHKAIIEQGMIGDVYYAECDYYHGIGPWYGQFRWNIKKDFGGSSLLTAGIHALDMLLYLTKGEVEEVFSYPTTNPNPVYDPYEYPTTTVTLLKFKNGRTLGKCASVTDCMQPYLFHMHFVGSHGSLRNGQFYSKKIDGLLDWSDLKVQLVDSGDVAHHPYAAQFSHLAESLDAGTEPINNFESAFKTHVVAYAADRSAETGKPVKLSEFTL